MKWLPRQNHWTGHTVGASVSASSRSRLLLLLSSVLSDIYRRTPTCTLMKRLTANRNFSRLYALLSNGEQESWAIAKMTARCALYGALKIFESPWVRSRLLFPKFLMGFLFRSIMRMCVQNLKFAALPVPGIIGVTKKIGQSLGTPTFPFLQSFEWAFARMDPANVPAKFEVCSFTRSWGNSDWSFVGCEPQSWGRGGCRGSGTVPFERALVISYRLLCLDAFQRYCRFCAPARHIRHFFPPHLYNLPLK